MRQIAERSQKKYEESVESAQDAKSVLGGAVRSGTELRYGMTGLQKLLLPEHSVATNRIPKGTTHKYIRQEMNRKRES